MDKSIILVFGRPGSGKTTLSKKIQGSFRDVEHINADNVRRWYSDWDFSKEGRERQARRMLDLAHRSPSATVILDFVCPFQYLREMVNPTLMFYCEGGNDRYPDTNSIFEEPKSCDNLIVIKKIR